jgi:kynurenine formamidase
MKTLPFAAVVLLAAACTAAPSSSPGSPGVPFPSGTLVDLSHPYDERTIFWPTAETFRIDKVADGVTEKGYYYAANNIALAEHGGTHLDAPVHFAQGRQTVDQIPLERLMGEAVVVDVSRLCEAQPDYQVTVEDLQAWEQANGRIPEGAMLLIRTGFSRRWPDAASYLGTAERGPDAVPKLHFPGLHPDAARWIASSRPIKALGIDTASIDYGQSTLFETHRVLYERDIIGIENLTNLDRLPPRGAWVMALPMKIGGGSGAPVRAIAIVPVSGP